ncbi:MAG TPA: DUF1963 domain-containing protein [Rhodobacteraceae bacterium]|nr:DUF1963 domain-containing protein [Paracoccaceae bacterium]
MEKRVDVVCLILHSFAILEAGILDKAISLGERLMADLQEKYAKEIAAAKARIWSTPRTRLVFETGESVSKYNPLSSRIGGQILWPDIQPLPKTSDGRVMEMVLQINLAEFPKLPDFPASGLLQLFLSYDGATRSITFSKEHEQTRSYPTRNGDGFHLVYHPDPTQLTIMPYVPPLQEEAVLESGFHQNAIPILLNKVEEMIPPPNHWLGRQEIMQFANLIKQDEYDAYDILVPPIWGDDPRTSLEGFHLGGYASPGQLDQRYFFPQWRWYDRCVLHFEDLVGLQIGYAVVYLALAEEKLREGNFSDAVFFMGTI